MDDRLWFTVWNGLVMPDGMAFMSRFGTCELWVCLPWDAEVRVIDG